VSEKLLAATASKAREGKERMTNYARCLRCLGSTCNSSSQALSVNTYILIGDAWKSAMASKSSKDGFQGAKCTSAASEFIVAYRGMSNSRPTASSVQTTGIQKGEEESSRSDLPEIPVRDATDPNCG